MRIAVCGPESQDAIKKIESVLKVESKKPWILNGETNIVDVASETYKYFGEHDVVFEGSAFDFLDRDYSEGYDDVYEQIALNSLQNLDYIIVITVGMAKNTLKMYNEYAKMNPNKFYLYNSTTDFDIIMK